MTQLVASTVNLTLPPKAQIFCKLDTWHIWLHVKSWRTTEVSIVKAIMNIIFHQLLQCCSKNSFHFPLKALKRFLKLKDTPLSSLGKKTSFVFFPRSYTQWNISAFDRNHHIPRERKFHWTTYIIKPAYLLQ